MVGNNLFLRSNGHMVPGLSLLQSKSIALNEMVMTWSHCCNWAVGDVFTTMSVTDSAMPKTAWLKDSICLAKQVVCCQNQDYLTLSSGSQPPSMLHQSKCPYVNPFGPYGSISPGRENGQSVAFFLELCCDQTV